MTDYQALFFGGPAHGRNLAMQDDMHKVDFMVPAVENVREVMAGVELTMYETKTVTYVRQCIIQDYVNDKVMGYYFQEPVDPTFYNAIMNMQFGGLTVPYDVKKVNVSED